MLKIALDCSRTRHIFSSPARVTVVLYRLRCSRYAGVETVSLDNLGCDRNADAVGTQLIKQALKWHIYTAQYHHRSFSSPLYDFADFKGFNEDGPVIRGAAAMAVSLLLAFYLQFGEI